MFLDQGKFDEMVALIAETGRDGDMHRALQRCQQTDSFKPRGPFLPTLKTERTTFKMLGWRLDRVAIDHVSGRQFMGRVENSATSGIAVRYRQFVCWTLNQNEENKVPFGYCHSQHVLPLLLAMHREHEVGVSACRSLPGTLSIRLPPSIGPQRHHGLQQLIGALMCPLSSVQCGGSGGYRLDDPV